MSMLETTSQIVQTDFSKTKFDGGVRESFQFVVYFTRKIDASGLATILSLSILPYAEISDEVLLTKEAHDKSISQAQARHILVMDQWRQNTTDHEQAVETLETEPGVDPLIRRQNVIALGGPPVEPLWQLPATDFTAAMSHALQSYNKELRYQNDQASRALELLQSLCTPKFNDFCATGCYDVEDVAPRKKLLHMFEWIKALRQTDMNVVGQVQADMQNLRPITTFPEAVSNIVSMDSLQRELRLMNSPYTDQQLILIHTSKMDTSERFKCIRRLYLQSDHHHRVTTAPNVKGGINFSSVVPPKHTWNEYCAEIQSWLTLETPIVSSLSATAYERPKDITVNAALGSDNLSPSQYSQSACMTQILDLLKSLSPPKPLSPFNQRRQLQQQGDKRYYGREHQGGHGQDSRYPRDDDRRSVSRDRRQSRDRDYNGQGRYAQGGDRSRDNRDERSADRGNGGRSSRDEGSRDRGDGRYGNRRRHDTRSQDRGPGGSNTSAYGARDDRGPQDDDRGCDRDDGRYEDERYRMPPDYDYCALATTGRMPSHEMDYATDRDERDRR